VSRADSRITSHKPSETADQPPGSCFRMSSPGGYRGIELFKLELHCIPKAKKQDAPDELKGWDQIAAFLG